MRVLPRLLTGALFLLGLTAGPVDFAQAQKVTNPHGNLKTACESCHSSDSWVILKSPMVFDHNRETSYPLTGTHQSVSCTSCHRSLDFSQADQNCKSCHEDIHRGTLGQACEECHATSVWGPLAPGKILAIHQKSRFPLTGAHPSVNCSDCHSKSTQGLTFRVTHGLDCFSCHSDDYLRAVDPDHRSLGFPRECLDCHSPFAWTPSSFNHSLTAFPLTGAHSVTTCSGCHTGKKYKGTPKNCFSCHETDYRTAKNPDHAAGNLSVDCQTCHSTQIWRPSLFNHAATRFPLTGAHSAVVCQDCHKSGQFEGTATDCFSCHQADYQTASNPKHSLPEFPENCLICHTVNSWKPAAFDHNKTKFPLTGSHISTECKSCHTNGVYSGLGTDCASCHQKDATAATNPRHTSAAFNGDCIQCHTTLSWKPAEFNHTLTRFPLTGAHAPLDCESCHAGRSYVTLPGTTCFSCHADDYSSAQNPKHTPESFSQNCETCHSVVSWKPASFDHNKTKFPLTGSHASTDCAACHTNGVYTGLSTDCAACHQKDYDGTTNPKHTLPAFSALCQTCHTTTAWKPASFDHNKTKFPLTGSHASTDCAACHTNGVYTGLSTDCAACHQKDYDGTTNPKHTLPAFSVLCQTCHTTTAWKPASFDHNKTAFPLTGGHITVDCADCHKNGQYTGIPTDCYSCHTTDFNKAANHLTQGYPVACLSCHTTVAWKPSTYNNHNGWFPIYSGKHKPSVWSSKCVTCHTVSTNFKVFVCTNCHEHTKTKMDSEHRNVSGYVWNSANCYSCHPDGNDAMF